MRTTLVIEGVSLSEAWARTVIELAAQDKHRACHVITRIADPAREDARIREMADGILAERGLDPVSTVANTLFPEAMARSTPDPEALRKRYLELLPMLKHLDSDNSRGTYFERLVNYETPGGHLNQLAEVVRRLKQESAVAATSTTGAKHARYEVGMEQLSASLPVLEAEHDTNPIGFPCLTLLSFQLDDGRVHAIAHYRSQYLFQRGYGNYLAVCRLLCYVCEQANLAPGEVTIVAGYAQVDRHRKSSVQVLENHLSTDQLM
ncbi:hypothetical protein [Nocardioides sp. REDSEA-S30_B4]|jgi:thymidylate synthase|uniref:hypothetical protein n=1 Tax=Nocardioides sp. REDSEA-S30_B4 TaxID=1811552 RepID=UPI000B1C9D99|nr:hypothetical protein [Nocardioides sp. REDSEA-S30_B4]